MYEQMQLEWKLIYSTSAQIIKLYILINYLLSILIKYREEVKDNVFFMYKDDLVSFREVSLPLVSHCVSFPLSYLWPAAII